MREQEGERLKVKKKEKKSERIKHKVFNLICCYNKLLSIATDSSLLQIIEKKIALASLIMHAFLLFEWQNNLFLLKYHHQCGCPQKIMERDKSGEIRSI